MSQTTTTSPTAKALKQGYEPSDVNTRGLLIFFICFALGGIVVQGGLWWLFKDYYMHQPRSVDEQTSAAPAPLRFPSPNLQPTEQHNKMPWQDLAKLRQEKGEIFKQMGWTPDFAQGTGTVPDEIIARLAEQRGGGSKKEGHP
jgi:hypothetical protein